MISAIGHNVNGMTDIVTGPRKDTHVAWMSPDADSSLAVTKLAEIGVYNSQKPREVDMGAFRAVALSADREDLIARLVQTK